MPRPPSPTVPPQAIAPPVYVGTAGWSVPRDAQPHFPAEGTHLVRYAARLPAAEINSSFYRPHRPASYARWAASVGPAFRFSVKLPRTITHEQRLADAGALLDAFLAGVSALGPTLGCLLVQLPPSLAFEPAVAERFLAALRARHDGPVALEPRHASWFDAPADARLVDWRVGRVAADPARVPAAAKPGGWPGTVYYRLHGSPRTYYSPYEPDYLDALAGRLARAAPGAAAWCVFDNTASGAAAPNALALLERLQRAAPRTPHHSFPIP